MLSWNEIRDRALRFSNEWKDETSENAEAKSFWDDFFNVFGIHRRRVATFETKVKTLNGRGYIDLLWKGVMLVEHKSKGRDLERAYAQATDYFPGLKESELPKYILVSDFENFTLYDLETGGRRNFTISQLPENIELFAFIAGYQKQEFKEQSPVNIEAAEKMGQLHDKLKDIGYAGHELEVYLVRLLFCLFADDTGIFEKNIFRDYIEQHTKEDGTDLGAYFEMIFDNLNKPKDKRFKNLDDSLNAFPYVNGKLYEERLPVATFDTEMRELFLECCILDWGAISPAIFGSMFQSVMNPEERRSLGAHYTSESNIMKVIKPLFLDDLYKEFESVKGSKKRLENFHEKLANLKFLDPACGCGNFLIVAYRELRILEIEVVKEQIKGSFQRVAFLEYLLKVDVDQFYGIEVDDFSAQIAQVALWLMDHQMNMKASLEFGEYFVRLPLNKKAHITHDNALQADWEQIIPKEDLDYILGNPPFIGSSMLTDEQKKDLDRVATGMRVTGHLDFVAGWYIKSARYIQGTDIRVGLVSTNSVVQGEHAINLWPYLLEEHNLEIYFAHQTFNWTNEARGKAAVYCVIVGFSAVKGLPKVIYTYPDIKGDPTVSKAKQINQYLVDAPTIFIKANRKPISDVPPMIYGTKPTDGGHLIFTEEEMLEFIVKEPLSEKYFRPWIGAHELVNSYQRYCLYLANCPPNELRKMPRVLERVEAVKNNRLASKAPSTRDWANYPTRFKQDNATDGDIMIVPRHTSENRILIPIGYYKYPTVCSDAAFQVIDASPYLFGVLNSAMHMAWVKTVAGRLKGDFRYSNTLIYNNFVFPEPTDKDVKDIEKIAESILEIRQKYIDGESTLADLYKTLTMPIELVKAHQKLDKAIDKAYRKKFKNDEERVAHLFELYENKIGSKE